MIELEYRIQVMDSAVVHHSLTCSWASSFAQPVLEQKVKSEIIIFLWKSYTSPVE